MGDNNNNRSELIHNDIKYRVNTEGRYGIQRQSKKGVYYNVSLKKLPLEAREELLEMQKNCKTNKNKTTNNNHNKHDDEQKKKLEEQDKTLKQQHNGEHDEKTLEKYEPVYTTFPIKNDSPLTSLEYSIRKLLNDNGFKIGDKGPMREGRQLIFCIRNSDQMRCVFKIQPDDATTEFDRMRISSSHNLSPPPLVLFRSIRYRKGKQNETYYGYIMQYVPGPMLLKEDILDPKVIEDIVNICIDISSIGITAHDLNICNFMYATTKRDILWRIDLDIFGKTSRNRGDLWRGNMSFYEKTLETNIGHNFDPDRKFHRLWAAQAAMCIITDRFFFFEDEYEHSTGIKKIGMKWIRAQYKSLSLVKFIQLIVKNGNDTDSDSIAKHIHYWKPIMKKAYDTFQNDNVQMV